MFRLSSLDSFFFFNDTATTEIYTLSLHDALPICPRDAVAALLREGFHVAYADDGPPSAPITHSDRFVLIDRELRIRGYYHGTDDADVARLLRDAAALHDGRAA